MAGPLLETKLQAPRQRGDFVARPRLSERLSREAESELTLISAPPGFGKTTLLADWLAGTTSTGGPAAWLSLDRRDNDPALFWTYVVTAVKTAYGVGADALTLLQSQQSIETVIASLLNDLQAVSNDVVLVLDDYQVIDARDVQEGMAFLLEDLPQHVHVVIAGRADPPLPLARLRGRGELAEIRAADLRFTPEEAATYQEI
jgi:LuxR family maltose regulon positive regulatory protein